MKYIYAFYLWVVGGLSYLLIFLFCFILYPFISLKYLHRFFTFWSKIVLRILFLKPKMFFEQNIATSTDYIFMPNHVSIMDVILFSAFSPVDMIGIEAHSHFRWPIYGMFLKAMKQIPINRTSATKSIESFEAAKKRLLGKWSIVVYPEGTRSRDGKLQNFKKLPFKFAKETSSDIVPIAFIGVEKIAPENSIFFIPRRVKIVFGKHITAEQIQNMPADELLNNVKAEVQRMLDTYTK